jgi:hypothetical protein
MTEIEAADAPPVAGRVSHADAISEMRETEAGPSTVTRGDKPLSAYETFKAMPLSERCMYAFAALPVLPVLLLVGPIIAAAKCAEGDNSRYYKGAFQAARLHTPLIKHIPAHKLTRPVRAISTRGRRLRAELTAHPPAPPFHSNRSRRRRRG